MGTAVAEPEAAVVRRAEPAPRAEAPAEDLSAWERFCREQARALAPPLPRRWRDEEGL